MGVTPWKYVERCTHHTPEGLKEIKVSNAGYWAIGGLSLSGMWVAALWFVLILVGVCGSGPRVHPEPDHHHHDGHAPEGTLALENMTEEEIADKTERDEIRKEKRRMRRCRKKCRRSCRMCCRATCKACGQWKDCKELAKKICKLIFKTQ